MSTIGTAYVQILPSAKGMSDALGKEMGNELPSTGREGGKKLGLGIKAGMVAAAVAGIAGIKSALSEGAKLEQSIGGIETVFKGSADRVASNAQKAWSTVGISANQYMENATLFGAALSKNLSSTAEMGKLTDVALRSAGDTANKFGMDMNYVVEGYQSLMRGNFQMLDSLAPGYAGTKTGLMELLKDTSSYKKEQEKLGLTVDATSTDFDNIVKALAVYNQHMGVAGTTSKEAAKTLSGSINALKSSWTNMLGNMALGQNVDASMKAVMTSLFNVVSNAVPMIGNVFESLPGVMSVVIKEGIPQLLNTVKSLLTSMASSSNGFGQMITNMFGDLGDLSGVLLKASGGLVDAGLTLVQNLAKGVADGMPALIENMPKIISNLANIINTNAPKIISAGINIIKTLASGLVKAIPILIQNIPEILKALWNAFMAFQWISLGKIMGQGVKAVVVGIKAQWGKVVGGIKGYVKSIVAAFKAPFVSAKTAISKPLSAIKKLATNGWKQIPAKIKAALSGVKNALTAPFTKAKAALQAIKNKIKGMFPIRFGKLGFLKIPRISVSGGKAPFGIAGKGSLPKFSVSWAAKGGIVDGATLVGAGEKGAEAIVPLDPFWNRLSDGFANFEGKLESLAMMNQTSGGNLTVIMQLDGKTIGQKTVEYINGQTIQFGASPLNI